MLVLLLASILKRMVYNNRVASGLSLLNKSWDLLNYMLIRNYNNVKYGQWIFSGNYFCIILLFI